MVTVKAAHLRGEGSEKSFVALELSGDLELVQSQNTGRFYATTRRCFIPSTFDIKTAEQFVGKQMPGKIVRVDSDPYDYEIHETGETIRMAHTYEYHPEVEAPETTFKQMRASNDFTERESELFEEHEAERLLV